MRIYAEIFCFTFVIVDKIGIVYKRRLLLKPIKYKENATLRQ